MSTMRRPHSAHRAPLLKAVLLILLAAACPSGLSGQERPDLPPPGDALYQITLADGTELVARIVEVAGTAVTLETAGGARLTVERGSIAAVRPARGSVVRGEYWTRDRSDTRLYFTSTGRTLPAGEGYVGTYVIFLPFVAVGLTDRFTLAAGAPVLFGEFEPVYLAPKIQVVRTEAAQISVGTLAFLFDEEVGGIAYGVGTFGGPDRAVHLGAGWGYAGDDFSDEPVGLVGGELRVSRRVKLLTENYLLPDDVGDVFSFGLRIIGDRLSTDIGVAGLTGDDGGCCLPMVNFAYAFGGGG